MVVGFIKWLFSKKNKNEYEFDFDQDFISFKRLTVDDISYDLNNEVPKLYIKSKEVGVVSMTKHYVTTGADTIGTNTTTFIYVTKDDPEQKILSINNLGEVFDQ